MAERSSLDMSQSVRTTYVCRGWGSNNQPLSIRIHYFLILQILVLFKKQPTHIGMIDFITIIGI